MSSYKNSKSMSFKSNHNLDDDLEDLDHIGMNMEALLQTKSTVERNKKSKKDFKEHKKRRDFKRSQSIQSSTTYDSNLVSTHYFR